MKSPQFPAPDGTQTPEIKRGQVLSQLAEPTELKPESEVGAEIEEELEEIEGEEIQSEEIEGGKTQSDSALATGVRRAKADPAKVDAANFDVLYER